jgi:hypothetical protein
VLDVRGIPFTASPPHCLLFELLVQSGTTGDAKTLATATHPVVASFR